MALDPPQEVVQLLQFIGIDWPMINEDTVREVAGFVQEFADNLQSSHQDATQAIQTMGVAYQGASYDALVQGWADKSNTHMTALLDACHVVVTALDAAADFIVAQKVVAIGELVVLAASFVADQAAAVATFGLAEAALAAIELAARKAVEFLEQQLEQFIIAEVIEAGFKALKPVIESALQGFVFQASAGALGVVTSAGSGGAAGAAVGGVAGGIAGGAAGALGSGYMVQPDQLRSHAQVLHGHADAVAGHAQVLMGKLSGVSFA
jgi:uncharacterized protein YukE